MNGNILKGLLTSIAGIHADLSSSAVHDRIIELESRQLWIDGELSRKENQSFDTCLHSTEMLESLEDERNLIALLTNVMYRREKILNGCK